MFGRGNKILYRKYLNCFSRSFNLINDNRDATIWCHRKSKLNLTYFSYGYQNQSRNINSNSNSNILTLKRTSRTPSSKNIPKTENDNHLRFHIPVAQVKMDANVVNKNLKVCFKESPLSTMTMTSSTANEEQQLHSELENLSLEPDIDDVEETKISGYAALLQKNEENIKLWKEVSASGCVKVAYTKPKIIRSRKLNDASAVFQCNAWDDVEWDDEMSSKAQEVVSGHSKVVMSDDRKSDLESNAHKFWDDFYGVHKNRFFRDRNWLFSEFPELESPYGGSVECDTAFSQLKELRNNEKYPGENSKFKVLEVGCGAGNTVFPLLSSNNNPHTYVYCCDFSPQAVDLVKTQAYFESSRCTPFVLNITEANPVTPFEDGSIDVITSIFVLSAISPNKYTQVMKNFHRFLKPGGLVLFRDYGRYDLAQLRFKDGRLIEENFYVRGDGTRVYFFNENEIEELFQAENFTKKSLVVDRRLQVNRGRQLKMYRVWVQGKFIKS